MFSNSSFGNTVDLISKGMDVAVMRREVIANNLANGDVPNFKRSEINFESELRRALASRNADEGILQPTMTDSRHMSFSRQTDWRTVEPEVRLDYLTTTDNNGNNVNIETETMAELQNTMQYELMTTMINAQFSQVNLVLR